MSERKRIGPRKKFKPINDPLNPIPIESDEYLSFIVGRASNGVAYGLTWEQYDPNSEEKHLEPDKSKRILKSKNNNTNT